MLIPLLHSHRNICQLEGPGAIILQGMRQVNGAVYSIITARSGKDGAENC